ncbi:hypothetical protein EZS27_003433 [termite gut metagenome]|uniref:VWFA domain-containing protein n=1 Tax=termite gut metagenome TaxID=433724 RepID=A0A5J4SV97_9ZZZZ
MQSITDILIDFSASMSEKLSLTKSVLLNDVIPYIDYSSKLGLKTFSATKEKKPIIKTILPLSITNKEQILHAVQSLANPNGNTPIAAAIKESIDCLKEYPAFDKKIILITDGEENCGGNYENEVKRANMDGINCHIHIIGIGLQTESIRHATNISISSKGTFSSIPYNAGIGYNQTAIKQNLSNFYAAIQIPKPITQPINIQEKEAEVPIVVKQIVLENNINKDSEKSKEENLPKDIFDNNDSILKNIVDEIREIKNELKALKKEKQEELNFEEDSELNEKVRKNSEEYVYELLKKKYYERVVWLNEMGESYANYDFEIRDLDNSIEMYIECKGTTQNQSTFYLTKEEWRLFLNNTKNYQIYFVRNTFNNPSHVYIDNLMDWILKGKIVPYLLDKQNVKKERVVLTIISLTFDK